jgi:DNA replication protein DnaC
MTTKTKTATAAPDPDDLRARARSLGFHGMVEHWDELAEEPVIQTLLAYEEEERKRRSLERRCRNAKLGDFKPIADFEWTWPSKAPRDTIEELLQLEFLDDATNVILLGPNGVGKSMIAQNLAHQALLRGHTVLFETAGKILADLASQEGAHGLERRLRRLSRPQLLVIDEVGYLSYDNRYADLFFEVINRRYMQKSTILTTNKPFAEWSEVFPNATCVVTLVDRLVHRAEIVPIEGDSYRRKEAEEIQRLKAKIRAEKQQKRAGKKKA